MNKSIKSAHSFTRHTKRSEKIYICVCVTITTAVENRTIDVKIIIQKEEEEEKKR